MTKADIEDALTEAEEFVDMACREAVASGFDIGEYNGDESGLGGSCCCPMQAVAMALCLDDAMEAEAALDLAWFGDGYDGTLPHGRGHASYQMGQRFRERVEAGEYR